MKIEVTIFNMNNMQREVNDIFDSHDFFKEELEIIEHINKKNGFLNLFGVEVHGLKFRIYNQEKFIHHVFSKYFEGYKVTKPVGAKVGQPDYVLEKGEEKIYLELKIGSDALRLTQLDWFYENKNLNGKLIFIDWENDFSLITDGSI